MKTKKEDMFSLSKRLPRRICFGDITRGEHVIPLADIRLESSLLSESKNPDEEPDNIAFFIRDGEKMIRVDAGLWYEIQGLLMDDRERL